MDYGIAITVILLYIGAPFLIVVGVVLLREHLKKKEEAEKRLQKEQEKREEQAHQRELENKYRQSPICQKAAEEFAAQFIIAINNLDRDIRVQRIHAQPRIEAFGKSQSDFLCSDVSMIEPCRTLIDFLVENLSPLHSKDEMCAFVRATASLAHTFIKSNYPKDKSGTAYTLELIEECSCGEYASSISISFQYSAPNGFYIPPQQW